MTGCDFVCRDCCAFGAPRFDLVSQWTDHPLGQVFCMLLHINVSH